MTATKKTASAAKPFEAAAEQMKSQFDGFVKAGQQQFGKQVEQAMAAAKEQVEKTSTQLLKGYDEATAFQKANVEALVQSGSIAAKGAEDLGKAVAAYSRTSFQASVAAFTSLLGAKSLREAVDLQTGFAKASYDAHVAEVGKLSELSVKVANEALAPLGARVQAAVQSASKAAA